MNEYQIKALAALRSADESKRLQGTAFVNGRMCACVVIVNGIEPGKINVKGKSWDDDQGVYTAMTEWFTKAGMQEIINLNDAALNMDSDTPRYTFAEIADQLEPQWNA